jgi:hypothetical protein
VKRCLSGWHNLILIVLLTSAAGYLSGCEERQENEEQLSFQFVLPEGWQVVNADHTGRVTRLDTDGDQEAEWVLLYSFDTPGNENFVPIRCAVYHTVRREPRLPIIYPYHLQAPGWTYLGEGSDRVSVRVEDVLTDIEPDSNYAPGTYFAPNEVIVESRDPSGRVTRASIFQWRNTVVPAEYRKRIDPREHIVIPSEPPEGNSQWYQCIGLFEGSAGVQVEADEVTVSERLDDRSQLARVQTYEPTAGAGGYLRGGQELVTPVSSCVDFAYGLGEDIAQSPYPEKIVMAFHKQFRAQDADYGALYLTERARLQREAAPEWTLFGLNRLPPVQSVCIKELRYGNEMSAEMQSYRTSITTQGSGQKPPPITTQVETRAEYRVQGRPVTQTTIVWELIKDEDVWKINDILQIE